VALTRGGPGGDGAGIRFLLRGVRSNVLLGEAKLLSGLGELMPRL
jgi:hypothetical protein